MASSGNGDRRTLTEKTGIDPKLILAWANHADLIRIKGMGSEYADLLKAAGVDTVPELARRNPANLRKHMEATNTAKKLVRQLPSEDQVAGWVAQAKTLPRKISR